MKRYKLITLFGVLMIGVFLINSSINQSPQFMIQQNSNNSKPNTAGVHTFDIFILNENFQTDKRGTGSFNWSITTGTGASQSWIPGNLTVKAGSSATLRGNTLELMVNLVNETLLGYEISNAQIVITWSFIRFGSNLANASWQYSKNYGIWTNITGSIVTANFTNQNTILNFNQAALNGSETSLRLRCSAALRANAQVSLHKVQIGTFRSNITENNLTSLLDNMNIQVNFTRCGTGSGLSTNISQYQIFYAVNSSNINESSAQAVGNGAFIGDDALLSYNITLPNGTHTDTVVNYKFRVSNSSGTYFYWSPLFTVKIGDIFINNATGKSKFSLPTPWLIGIIVAGVSIPVIIGTVVVVKKKKTHHSSSYTTTGDKLRSKMRNAKYSTKAFFESLGRKFKKH